MGSHGECVGKSCVSPKGGVASMAGVERMPLLAILASRAPQL